MRIVITFSTLRNIDNYLNELFDKYNSIIIRRNRAERTLILITEDVINGYSVSSHIDGIKADVAIGINARNIVSRSNIENPVWEEEDLYKYLDSIVELMNEHSKITNAIASALIPRSK
jgi:hypothetical protein